MKLPDYLGTLNSKHKLDLKYIPNTLILKINKYKINLKLEKISVRLWKNI